MQLFLTFNLSFCNLSSALATFPKKWAIFSKLLATLVPGKSYQPRVVYHFSSLGPFVRYVVNMALDKLVFVPDKPF